jgi:hypothetical protein
MQEALDLFHANNDIFIEGIREHFNISKLHSLIHYTDSIILFGSLGGFDSEHPERLHIDYAKKGYRATNKRGYTIQITRWLQRQEAMDLCAAYLQWLDVHIDSDEDTNLWDPGSEEPVGGNDDGEAEYDHEVGHADTVLAELKADGAPLFTYKTAKKPPFPNTTVARLTSAYGATEFLSTLQIFLDHNMPHNVRALKPNQFDCFDVYNAKSILLPSRPHVSDTKRPITVRATPEHMNGPRTSLPSESTRYLICFKIPVQPFTMPASTSIQISRREFKLVLLATGSITKHPKYKMDCLHHAVTPKLSGQDLIASFKRLLCNAEGQEGLSKEDMSTFDAKTSQVVVEGAGLRLVI